MLLQLHIKGHFNTMQIMLLFMNGNILKPDNLSHTMSNTAEKKGFNATQF
jgi:hypothetical protein